MRSIENEVTPTRLLLLPGLDGTGQMFADFLAALPHTWIFNVVGYPAEKFASYSDLLPLIGAAAPKTESFVVLAESYSTPLALKYASTNPSNLAAVILCAGFVRAPIGTCSQLVKIIAKPWIFGLKPPRFILEHFLTGKNPPPALTQRLRQALQLVSPGVLCGRAREALGYDARHDLTRTSVPIMYLHASHDRLLSASCHKEILRIRPDIAVATIRAPHLLLQREPGEVANIVTTFVEQLGARRGHIAGD